MNVLLAVDESLKSAEAIQTVLDRLWPPDTTVHVLSVVEPLSEEEEFDTVDNERHSRKQLNEQARRLTSRIADSLRAQGVEAEPLVREGRPHCEILDEAEEWPADLIIVGSKGDSDKREWLLGSVAQYVVNDAPCLVEIVSPLTEADNSSQAD